MIREVVFLLSLVFLSEAQDTTLPTLNWADPSQLVYSYDTETHITDNLGSLSPNSAVKLSMQISITNVANLKDLGHLLQLVIKDPRVGQTDQQKDLEGPMPLKSAFIVWKMGVIENLYVGKNESTFWTNVYRGLASLIQSKTAPGEYQDVDASGECNARYRQVEHNLLERVKRRCSSTDLSDEVNSHGEGRKVRKFQTGRTILRLRASDNILESAEGKDTVTVTVPVAGQIGPSAMTIESSQYLELQKVESHQAPDENVEDAESVIARLEGAGAMRLTTLASDDEVKPKVTTKQLRKVIQQHQALLTGEDGPKTESVTAFKSLLTALRGVRDARIILKILDDEDLIDVTPAVLDAVVICATGPCINVVFKRLRLKDPDNPEEQERLLTGLSHMVEPDEETLIYLLEGAKKLPRLEAKDELDGVRAQLWATVGALIGKYRLSPTGKYSKVTKDTVDFLQNQLNGNVNEDVILAILTALQNVGEAPETAPVILGYLVNSNVSHRVHCAAIDTMMTVGISDQVRGLARSRALRLVQSRPFLVDVTARIRALDFLLSLHPTMAQVIAAARAFKVSSHLRDGFINRFRPWCRRENREDLWALVMQHFPDLIQYPGAAQPPQTHVSTLLSGNSSKGEVSGESAVDLTTDEDGSLRRSDSSAQLKLADTSRLPLYRLVLFTDGLNTASGSEGESAAGDVTAGIGLSILGVSIRPVRLFSGYGGLMSAIWNAPTSFTPFLQINLAFIDAQHIIHLQNGFSVRFVASGLAAIDLSGMMTISLWSQKADSKMKTIAAIGLSVNAELVSSRMSARLVKSGSATFAMNFDANAEFSSLPPKICFLASFPDTEMIWRVQKLFGKNKESFKGRRLITGKTLSFGRSSERWCGSLLKD